MLNAHRSLLAFAALALLSLGLAACGGDDDSGSDGGSTQPAAASGGETVSVMSIGGAGDVLVDAQGRALYTNDQDSRKKIVCTDTCLTEWLPLTAPSQGAPTSSDSAVQAELGTTQRPDGKTQVTYEGLPLYSFVEDPAGQVTGDGFTDSFGGTTFVWSVASAGGESGTAPTTTSDGGDSGGGGYGGY